MMPDDRLGEFLAGYDEYFDGDRSYRDLPSWPGGEVDDPGLPFYQEVDTPCRPLSRWSRVIFFMVGCFALVSINECAHRVAILRDDAIRVHAVNRSS